MANKTNYQRLMRKIIVEMSRMRPDADKARADLLNKRFKKYQTKLNTQ